MLRLDKMIVKVTSSRSGDDDKHSNVAGFSSNNVLFFLQESSLSEARPSLEPSGDADPEEHVLVCGLLQNNLCGAERELGG